MTRLWTILSISIVLILAGCPGGSAMPLTINSITPSTGVQGATVIFVANISGATGTVTYAWNFGTWATPTTSTDASPVVVLGSAGSYSGSLTITDDGGTALGMFAFEITASGNMVTAVSPTGDVGLPLGETQFEATTTSTPDSLAWFFGDGAEPQNYVGYDPVVTLQNPGTYAGTVTPTFGGVVADAFPFDYTVQTPTPPVWTRIDLADASLEFGKANTACLDYNGRLAVLFNAPAGLSLALATTATPTAAGDFDIHVIDPDGYSNGARCFTVHEDRLIVAYYKGEWASVEDFMWFAVAIEEIPTSASDWVTYAVHPGPSKGACAWEIIDGKLCLGFGSFVGGNDAAWLATTEEAEPHELADWEVMLISSNTGGIYATPQLIATTDWIYLLITGFDQDSIGYQAIVKAPRLPFPTEESDWDAYYIAGQGFPGSSDGSLFVQDSKLALMYSNSGVTTQVLLGVSESEDVKGVTDFTTHVLQSGQPFFSAGRDIGVLANRPLAVLTETGNGDLLILRAVRTDFLGANAPVAWELQVVDREGDTGILPSLAITNDVTAAACIKDGSPPRVVVSVTNSVF